MPGVLIASLMALFLGEWGFGSTVVILWLLTGVLSAISLLLPLRAVRDRIRAAKVEEFEICSQALAAVRSEPGRAREPEQLVRIAGLVAYRKSIDDVSEWILDISGWGRFAVYLLIPLGSWLGGALVERVVDAALR